MSTKSASTVKILSGAALAAAIDISGQNVVGIQMPSAWTAAALSFQGSFDGTTYGEILDSAGVAAAATAAASSYIALTAAQSANINAARWLIVRSGTSATPVNQGADRDLVIVTVDR